MSQPKYTHFNSDTTTFFQDKQTATDKLIHTLEVFMQHLRFGQVNPVKNRGYSLKSLFCGLFMQPFLSILSVYALHKSGLTGLTAAKKDAYYTMLRNENISWRSILT